MRVEDGKEVYEKGDFDNMFFYMFIGAIIPGVPLSMAYNNADMVLGGALIGAGIYLLRWATGLSIKIKHTND